MPDGVARMNDIAFFIMATNKSKQRKPASEDRAEPIFSPALPPQVSGVLAHALELGATDVHLDPIGHGVVRLCYRVDGVVQPHAELPAGEGRQLINQIKVAAQFTPDAVFHPMENRLAFGSEERHREVRVTVTPTTRREAVHLRLLTPPDEIMNLSSLGIGDRGLERIRTGLHQPEGLVLISGPTGSGKTMTLYSLVSQLELHSAIAISIEDPVEYDLPYVRQIQADEEHGLTMLEGLKTALRMDPDILMVGEIRDAQSATTAVRAAASGRFVLATLHARDAALAVEACKYLSVPRHMLGSTLRMIIAQNLVRRLCSKCASRRKPSKEEKELFKDEVMKLPSDVPAPEGCDACHDIGYRGRIGVFEIIPTDAEISRLITNGASADDLRALIRSREHPSLRRDALRKVAEGITSMDEVRDLHFPGIKEEI